MKSVKENGKQGKKDSRPGTENAEHTTDLLFGPALSVFL